MDREKLREAGEIHRRVMEEARDSVEVGKSKLEIAESLESTVRELGGQPAFPVNISCDEEAAHATPSRDDTSTLGEEMVCVDVGVHVDGWIADGAFTVPLGGEDALVEAAESALSAAVDLVEPGVSTAELGAAIQDAIEGYGYNPVTNLTGHGLGEYEQHTSPTVPNRAVDSGIELEEDMVVAIEPFATDGGGKVTEGGDVEIYSLNQLGARVRSRRARSLVEDVEDRYRTMPFAKRWLDSGGLDVSLRRLESQEVVHGYPVLREDAGRLVAQAEHTVIVTSDGCEVTTA
ncbi:MAG: type II methionyl aminopeptidase [Halobacteriales archaeon]